jgi:hypothetical protein
MNHARRVVGGDRRGMAWLRVAEHGFPAGGIMPAPPNRRCLAGQGMSRIGGPEPGMLRLGRTRMSRSAANPTTSHHVQARPGQAMLEVERRGVASPGQARIPSGTDKSRTSNRGHARHGNARLYAEKLGESWIPSAADNPRTKTLASPVQAMLALERRGYAQLGEARIPSGTDNSRAITIHQCLARMERPGDAWRVQVRNGMSWMPPRPANGGTKTAVQCRARHSPARLGLESAPSG